MCDTIFESLLEQHNSYELGEGLAIGRSSNKWLIYLNGKEVRFAAEPKRFDTAMDAIGYLRCEAIYAAIDAVRKAVP